VKIKIYKTIILAMVLYGCETWSLTLREEHRLMVFESMVLWRIFGPKRDEATGDWRKLHNEELHGLYSSPGIARVMKVRWMKWAGHIYKHTSLLHSMDPWYKTTQSNPTQMHTSTVS
jgi:hypothetical protein